MTATIAQASDTERRPPHPQCRLSPARPGHAPAHRCALGVARGAGSWTRSGSANIQGTSMVGGPR